MLWLTSSANSRSGHKVLALGNDRRRVIRTGAPPARGIHPLPEQGRNRLSLSLGDIGDHTRRTHRMNEDCCE